MSEATPHSLNKWWRISGAFCWEEISILLQGGGEVNRRSFDEEERRLQNSGSGGTTRRYWIRRWNLLCHRCYSVHIGFGFQGRFDKILVPNFQITRKANDKRRFDSNFVRDFEDFDFFISKSKQTKGESKRFRAKSSCKAAHIPALGDCTSQRGIFLQFIPLTVTESTQRELPTCYVLKLKVCQVEESR